MPLPGSVRKLLASQPVDLPIFHPVAIKLQQMLSNFDFTIEEVVSVANEDAALASQMLKMANSPMYMGRSKVSTIKETIIRLGAQQVINIAMAASQASIHSSSNPEFDRYMKSLWQHSHGAALGARLLAGSCGMPEPVVEENYLAALLHDVGKLYLLKSIERLVNAGVISSLLDEELVMEVFELMHVEQGFRLMQHWNFPLVYNDIIKAHHAEQWDANNKGLAIVRFVNLTCRSIGLGLKHEPDLDLAATSEAELLGIGEQQIVGLIALLEESRDAEI